jgi:hypothetical protein
MRGGHETVKVKVGKWKADIDVLLAPLIEAIWKIGIYTYQCCQESHAGLAEIEFPGTAEVEQFLQIAQRYYIVHVETRDEGDDDRVSIGVRLLVLFPTLDIPYLVERFKNSKVKYQ